MTLLTASDFVETLQTTGLLEATQLEELRHGSASGLDPRNLGRWLMDQGWLTPYQVNQLLAGRGQGLILGSYVLLERLGEGGMGQVFKARHLRLGRIAALKVIRKDRLTDPAAVRRFHREIQAVSKLSHPNIVLAFDADEVNGTHFFAMEYVEGVNLAQQVKDAGPFTVVPACEYIRQAALGLQHAHQQNMVHRDIKPSNLLLTWNTRPAGNPRSSLSTMGTSTGSGEVLVKVLDMGLALLDIPETEGESETLTQKGIFLGTPDFIAAEQASNPHSADIRSDLYSLGCTFYYLLTGQVPFPGGTTVDKLFRHRLEEPTPVEKLQPDVPRSVGAIVRKLMAKRPEDRYQTPAELSDALYSVIGDLRKRQPKASSRSALPTIPLAAPVLLEETPTGFSKVEPTAPRRRFSWGFSWAARKSSKSLLATPPESPVPPVSRRRRAAGAIRRAVVGTVGTIRRYRKLLALAAVAAVMIGCAVGIISLAAYVAPAAKTTEFAGPPSGTAAGGRKYVLKPSREETILATLKINNLPSLDGKWYLIGPFDNHDLKAFSEAFPPEKEAFSLDKSYPVKANKMASWKEFPAFKLGQVVDLRIFGEDDHACAYLYHTFNVTDPVDLPIEVGFDDNGIIWLNGQMVYSRAGWWKSSNDRSQTILRCNPGKNEILIKVCNWEHLWEIYLQPQFPTQLDAMFGSKLKHDFPPKALLPRPEPTKPGK